MTLTTHAVADQLDRRIAALMDGGVAVWRLRIEGRELREELGLSLRAVARLVDIPESTLCRWERGVTRRIDPYAAGMIFRVLDGACDLAVKSGLPDPRVKVRASLADQRVGEGEA